MQTHHYLPTEKKWTNRKYEKWCRRSFADLPRIRDILLQTGPQNNLPKFDADEGEGLFIYGALKSGKTILAAQLIMEEKKRLYLAGEESKKEILFVKVPKLLHQIKATYKNDEGESETQIISRLQNAHVLVLDEFGMSKPSDWLLDLLYLVIDHRYETKASTIYSSNYDLGTLTEILEDERIPSRIERTCRIIKKTPWQS